LYTAAQVRELDRIAIEEAGIPGYTLMSRAGEAAWRVVKSEWPDASSFVVVCGTGNNGGDGYVLARLAMEGGYSVRILQLGDAASIKGEARTAREALLAAGGEVIPFDVETLKTGDVIIDALLGTGLERPLNGAWRDAVTAINALRIPVLAIDIPSGLHSDTGAVLGATVNADHTVTFIGRKRGLYTGEGPEHCGVITLVDLQVPVTIYDQVTANAQLLSEPPLGPLSRPRPRTAHKGDHGHLLIVGGDRGMSGAVQLAGMAALRVGAGLVSLATRPEHAALTAASCPELMCHDVASARTLRTLLARATAVAIGPGLGRSRWAQELLSVVLESSLPLVVDADALNLLAQEPVVRDNWVLTPHPGEAGRLLDAATAEVQADRYTAVCAIARRFGGVVVLKGAGTLVCAGDGPIDVCIAGNPGMASGGMGDVLTGVIGGLLVQGLVPVQAATAGVCVHAHAGDRAAQDGERGMMATDVIARLRTVMQIMCESG
jgi:NAD(P)H-hydrate epimerase